ncbi:ferredoxin-NADP reductase/predicted pyridoxine 5'-phosphate oxidase superfamily flavin-nucleotide-binding protein [Catenuloplanes nepalensis]|uniref:Ferredoxin-NADP reductase/predicted pyridoxine 5'-phosphate oxidase superfamily flavin-nucleotide-binding protein n=1 Tax=Catenuloplanes nepalensis TaxID=587533 RepID=A0ABT9MU35_9ACTN|nr:2Fe-2S iron-sulfur cluster-binding protein [Catenuloplanes nepalensis]MDP9794960.1 ferredoxin-NADP reductase/predicted pyridoxine 5'-phosphate oxidase superfamily flavin-nucleotide-binding protein [Catenuloplanes nepalensis]
MDEVESVVGRPPAVIMLKQISALDEGCRTILARSPIAAFGYRDADGVSRTTFVGGTPGFARVHSPTRLSFAAPDVPAGPVSLFFLLPGVGEVLRLNGVMAGRAVRVTEAYVHCAQAVLRSRLWQPPVPAAPAAPISGEGPLHGPGVAGFLAAAPFLALSTWDGDGGSDTSPRGDREAVARILDGRTLAIPDRRGNKRADTLHNLLRDDRLAFAALVPGRSGVLHVTGRGTITDDPALLSTMALRGQAPHAALLIDVEHAEVRGNDAVARARIWSPGTHLGLDTAPNLIVLASRHLAANTAKGGFLLRAVSAIPGIGRLLRPVMNRAYRSGLLKEGYEDVTTGPVTATSALVTAAGAPVADPLRTVRIAEVRRETLSAVTLVLEDTDGGRFDFRPGQYFTLVADVGGHPIRRAYSASSAPGSSRLEVTIKHVDGGRFSGHVHRGLRAGDTIAVLGPSGTFHLPEPPGSPGDLVLIAAGSGVTPMMSMIRAYGGRVSLLYSNRTEDEIIFGDELNRRAESGQLSVTHVLTRRDGRLDAHGVHRWISGLTVSPDTHYFVCGPDALMDTVHSVLTGLGVPPQQVHQERYSSGTDAAATTTTPQEMTVDSIGTVVVEPGQTLLDAGLAAGLPMPYSCTIGNCGDCLVRLRAGEVTTSDPNNLTRPGYVLACLSCPLTPVTLDITPA